MSRNVGIFTVVNTDRFPSRSIPIIQNMCENLDKVYLVIPESLIASDALQQFESKDCEIIGLPGIPAHSMAIKAALAPIKDQENPADMDVWISNSDVYGLLQPIDELIETVRSSQSDIVAPYFHDLSLDVRFTSEIPGEKIPYFDFTVFKASILSNDAFWKFWDNKPDSSDYWSDLRYVFVPFVRLMREQGYKIDYFTDVKSLETADPRIFEVHKVARDCPVISRAPFQLSAQLYDAYAIEGKAALEIIRSRSRDCYDQIWRDINRTYSLRSILANFDQLEVIPDVRSRRKSTWNFGRVAVFIHAYYARMMPEFWTVLNKLPDNYDLYISTATYDAKDTITEFLEQNAFPNERYEIRLVEENRGRDMSSLFITFRDVILSEKHDVCLRLHSKRTPQVSRQVGESFKAHLFDNLVFNEAYVSNLYDLLEEYDDIGLVIPPTIHVGFGTLGHAWFNNFEGVQQLFEEMDIRVPFDRYTPVAPYGTMFWFRAKALKPMFEQDWKWEDYNEEPNHVDGGLAHLQERMIGYITQSTGYRVLTIMNRHAAARNYAKLQYKAQLFSAQLPTSNFVEQCRLLEEVEGEDRVLGLRRHTRRKLYDGLARGYAEKVVANPSMHKFLRPILAPIGAMLRRFR